MTIVLPDTKPCGEAQPYLAFMSENGIGRSTAYNILNTDYGPPTFKVGSKLMIDKAIGRAWFQALANGVFTIDSATLKGDAA